MTTTKTKTFDPAIVPIVEILGKDEKELIGRSIRVAGSVKSAPMLFLHLRDGSTTEMIQLVFRSAEQRSMILKRYGTQFYPSTTVRAKTTVAPSKGKGHKYDFLVDDLEIIGVVKDPDTFLPALRGVSIATWSPHCDVRVHSAVFQAIYTIRSRLSSFTHAFMDKKRVKHLDPNVVTSADCEGAGEMFIVTTLPDAGPIPMDKKGQIDWKKDFFQNVEPARLTVSSQLGLEYLVPGIGAVYTTNPSFRAEKSKTSRHVASFTHVEAELPWIDFGENMDFQEEYVVGCFRTILDQCPKECRLLEESEVAPGLTAKLTSFVSKPFIRMPYIEALEILDKHKEQVMKDIPEIKEIPKFGDDLKKHCEDWVAKFYLKHPVFVYNMPAALKSFYMLQNTDEEKGKETVQGADLLIPGLGELIGGSMREYRYDKLLSKLVARGMFLGTSEKREELKALFKESKEPVEEFVAKYKLTFGALAPYLALRKNAATPTGGFGLGFDRLVVVCTSGLDGGNIRHAIPFPVAYQELDW